MNREEALKSIEARVSNANLVKHMLATEAVMRALAKRLGQDEAEWGLAGLLHDIDIDLIQGDLTRHSKLGAELVRELGASEAISYAVLCHNQVHSVPRLSLLDKALYSADPLAGLITAATLVRPDRKLSGLDVSSVLKRFKEKRFAAAIVREQIADCTELGMQMDEFVALALKAMQEVAPGLGL